MQSLENFEHPMVEYVWEPVKTRTTKTGVQVKLDKPIKRGKKIAVLFAGVHKDNPQKVGVGFAMCHSRLDCDGIFRSGNLMAKDPHGGKKIAAGRALKWMDKPKPVKNMIKQIETNPMEVLIPASIYDHLEQFSERVVRYYKDKDIPEWVTRLINK